MFRETARYYDLIYEALKDYPGDAALLRARIAEFKRSPGKRLLDMACGTGKHLAELQSDFEVMGADLDETMLAVARERLPRVRFAVADMPDFQLGERFDVITCLFSSIGYVGSIAALRATCSRFAEHLVPGGVVLIEPWLTPDVFQPGLPYMLVVDRPDLKLCRMNTSVRDGRVSLLEFHYLIGTREGTRHARETHRGYLFTGEEMTSALEDAGLRVSFDHEGLPMKTKPPMKRGLYIAVKPM